MIERMSDRSSQFVEQYLGLESMEVTEILLELCGATLDERVLPLLKQRLQEEEVKISLLEARGYIRLREKSEQMVAALTSLIAVLSTSDDKEKRQ